MTRSFAYALCVALAAGCGGRDPDPADPDADPTSPDGGPTADAPPAACANGESAFVVTGSFGAVHAWSGYHGAWREHSLSGEEPRTVAAYIDQYNHPSAYWIGQSGYAFLDYLDADGEPHGALGPQPFSSSQGVVAVDGGPTLITRSGGALQTAYFDSDAMTFDHVQTTGGESTAIGELGAAASAGADVYIAEIEALDRRLSVRSLYAMSLWMSPQIFDDVIVSYDEANPFAPPAIVKLATFDLVVIAHVPQSSDALAAKAQVGGVWQQAADTTDGAGKSFAAAAHSNGDSVIVASVSRSGDLSILRYSARDGWTNLGVADTNVSDDAGELAIVADVCGDDALVTYIIGGMELYSVRVRGDTISAPERVGLTLDNELGRGGISMAVRRPPI
jgi:hypothetical protein